MTGKYDKAIISGRAGVYAAPRVIGPLRAATKRAGIAWYDLELSGAGGRDEFLRRCAKAFSLPGYFGNNWDALHECLLDLGGGELTGAIVHWRGGAELAQRSPETVKTALEILRDASRYWGSIGLTFVVAVDRGSAPGLDLPSLR